MVTESKFGADVQKDSHGAGVGYSRLWEGRRWKHSSVQQLKPGQKPEISEARSEARSLKQEQGPGVGQNISK